MCQKMIYSILYSRPSYGTFSKDFDGEGGGKEKENEKNYINQKKGSCTFLSGPRYNNNIF